MNEAFLKFSCLYFYCRYEAWGKFLQSQEHFWNSLFIDALLTAREILNSHFRKGLFYIIILYNIISYCS